MLTACNLAAHDLRRDSRTLVQASDSPSDGGRALGPCAPPVRASYEIPSSQDDPHDDDGDQEISRWMAALIAGHLAVEHFVEGHDSADDQHPEPPVSPKPIAGSPHHRSKNTSGDLGGLIA